MGAIILIIGLFIERLIDLNMKKNVVMINEAQLKKIVAESVKKVLREGNEAEREIFIKLCELYRLLDTTQYRDALGLENLHLKTISADLRPLLQKAITRLKPYVRS